MVVSKSNITSAVFPARCNQVTPQAQFDLALMRETFRKHCASVNSPLKRISRFNLNPGGRK
jgi:hypothetical protein